MVLAGKVAGLPDGDCYGWEISGLQVLGRQGSERESNCRSRGSWRFRSALPAILVEPIFAVQLEETQGTDTGDDHGYCGKFHRQGLWRKGFFHEVPSRLA